MATPKTAPAMHLRVASPEVPSKPEQGCRLHGANAVVHALQPCTNTSDDMNTIMSPGETDGASCDDLQDGGVRDERTTSSKASCDRCKARKVRCDRATPTCGGCARQNRDCVYKGKQKPGSQVVEKLNRLETLLKDMGSRLEKHITEHGDSPQTGLRSVLLASQSPQLADAAENTPQQTDPGIISHDRPVFEPWSGINIYERLQGFGSDNDMSIESIFDGAGQDVTATTGVAGTSTCFSHSALRPIMTNSELPPYDLLYTLADIYFKHVNSWCPILYRKATVDAFFGSQTIDEADRILLHAIIVTTLRFSKDLGLTTASRARFYKVSKQNVLLYVLEHPSVRALQALLILTVDALGTSSGEQARGLLALIARSIIQLGLDVERSTFLELPVHHRTSTVLTTPKPKSWVEDEERRRLCWMTFILDRYAAIETAGNFLLDEREMDRSLPCRYDLFSQEEPVKTRWYRHAGPPETMVNKPENLGSFSYHCEILLILSRIQRFLHRPLDITRLSDIQQWRKIYRDLDCELNGWLQSLPDEYSKMSQLCHPDPGSKISNWITLHAAFVTTVIRLHSPAAFPTVRSLAFAPTDDAIQRCLGAVESLRGIAQDVLQSGILNLLGHPFAFALWSSARVLLVHAATMESEVDSKISFFISTLEQMGQHWQVAQDYARSLRDKCEGMALESQWG
ncbi:putative transcriptional regulatory [Hyphodiscus hymeniophilus]|uniref:Transcriptional regulatory n=1 Tax=Hyphodiscus hymeniophilus TaxID=353542 RepID=A0A9P7AZD9_9HELO|nr:putative transcriptional regulatory [Hyphodiscus hymeniophilus]